MSELVIESDAIEGVSLVALRCHGDIDAHTVGELDKAVAAALESGASHMIVDFTDVGYSSSRGLGILIGARKTIKDRGGALVLLNPNVSVKASLEVLGFDGLFTIAETEQQALEMVKS
ncbi:MAG: STAS domain-containing protein [Planctomycetota bacterium]|jgi:anti-sigma B factor antagonist